MSVDLVIDEGLPKWSRLSRLASRDTGQSGRRFQLDCKIVYTLGCIDMQALRRAASVVTLDERVRERDGMLEREGE